MNLTRPASRSFRVIGCLMLLAYVFALPGMAPFALAGLAGVGAHGHEMELVEHAGQVKLVLHHHEVKPTSHDGLHFVGEKNGHNDHVIHVGSCCAARSAASAQPGSFTMPKLASSWDVACFAPVLARDFKCATAWHQPPPGGTAPMTCLRTTVLLV